MNEKDNNTYNYVTVEQLEQVLSKYLKTIEEIEKEKSQSDYVSDIEQLDNLLSKYFNTKDEQEKLSLSSINSNEEFQELLLQKIDSLEFNTQYTNNYFHFGVVIALLLFFSVLFYKFIKIFI